METSKELSNNELLRRVDKNFQARRYYYQSRANKPEFVAMLNEKAKRIRERKKELKALQNLPKKKLGRPKKEPVEPPPKPPPKKRGPKARYPIEDYYLN